jgi:hypothetical protein
LFTAGKSSFMLGVHRIIVFLVAADCHNSPNILRSPANWPLNPTL